jgi:hypothetical protein
MKLTDTQAVILAAAAQHKQGLVAPPAKLAPAPCDAVRKSLLAKGVIVQAELLDRSIAWQVEGEAVSYRITDAGLAAMGIAPDEATGVPTGAAEAPGAPEAPPVPQAAPTEPPRASLREAARQVLAAWDQPGKDGLPTAMDALRRLAAGRPARTPGQPRTGTKHAAVLAMLRRPEGATVAQVVEATGWQPHTVRGYFAGLKRRGITVVVQERVRQVGPNQVGAKGSYSVYRIAEAG